MMQKTATISPCGLYRYSLSRIWLPKKGYVCFVGLNPSTADATNDDPTIKRCIRYVESWGYGGLVMVNLFAYRATDPKDMLSAHDPVGQDNDIYIIGSDRDSEVTVCCWGTKGNHLDRDKRVMSMLRDPHYLKLTKDNYPSHPLYLSKDLTPQPYIER